MTTRVRFFYYMT